MFKRKYKIIRPFNHNVVYCNALEKKRECIIVGKGIGFGVKAGEFIKDENGIEKIFFIVERNNVDKFNNLTQKIDNNVVGIVEEAIAIIANSFTDEINEMLHVTLLDHINFAIKRLNSNIDMKNPFLYEIKLLYKEEFNVAQKVLELINQKLDINLPYDEIGFITMHIHAALNNTSISKANTSTVIIKESIDYIEDEIGVKIDKESIEYSRIIIHLRFAIDRAMKNIELKNIVLPTIKEKFKQSYGISRGLAEKIKDEFYIEFSEGEIGYMAIHLENIVQSMK